MPKAYASAVIEAPVEAVWERIRPFGAIAEWHSALQTCALLEGGHDTVGAVRRLTAGKAVFVERLTALDDTERTLAYEFVESPFAVRSYRATIRVAPITSTGQTFAEWWALYDADEAEAVKLTPFFADDVFAAGLRAVADEVAG